MKTTERNEKKIIIKIAFIICITAHQQSSLWQYTFVCHGICYLFWVQFNPNAILTISNEITQKKKK